MAAEGGFHGVRDLERGGAQALALVRGVAVPLLDVGLEREVGVEILEALLDLLADPVGLRLSRPLLLRLLVLRPLALQVLYLGSEELLAGLGLRRLRRLLRRPGGLLGLLLRERGITVALLYSNLWSSGLNKNFYVRVFQHLESFITLNFLLSKLNIEPLTIATSSRLLRQLKFHVISAAAAYTTVNYPRIVKISSSNCCKKI